MNRKEHLLTIAAEECSEVSQLISKALRFGLDDHKPGEQYSNADRIMQEYYDLKSSIKTLQDEGYLPKWSKERSEFQVKAKQLQVEKYLLYSKEKGTFS